MRTLTMRLRKYAAAGNHPLGDYRERLSVEDLRWRTSPVRLELTIWRPYEFSQQRFADRIQQASPGTAECERAFKARSNWKKRARTGFQADPHAYFIEVRPSDAMPWFMG